MFEAGIADTRLATTAGIKRVSDTILANIRESFKRDRWTKLRRDSKLLTEGQVHLIHPGLVRCTAQRMAHKGRWYSLFDDSWWYTSRSLRIYVATQRLQVTRRTLKSAQMLVATVKLRLGSRTLWLVQFTALSLDKFIRCSISSVYSLNDSGWYCGLHFRILKRFLGPLVKDSNNFDTRYY